MNIWKLFEGLICICKNFEPTLKHSVCFSPSLHCCKWPNIEQISKHWVNPKVRTLGSSVTRCGEINFPY